MAFRSAVVPNVSFQIAPFNKRRSSITLRNTGAQQMFISYDRVNILTQGTPLNVGDGVNFSAELGDDTRLALYAQTTIGTTDLRIAESFLTEAIVKEKLGESV